MDSSDGLGSYALILMLYYSTTIDQRSPSHILLNFFRTYGLGFNENDFVVGS